MKLYIYNGGCDAEFDYKKISDEKLEDTVAWCLGNNLGNRHYHLARRASKKSSDLLANLRVVELDEKTAHFLNCYETWQEKDCNKDIQGWEYLFPNKLRRMIVESKDVGLPSIKNLDEFNFKVLKVMRDCIHNHKRWDEMMQEVEVEA